MSNNPTLIEVFQQKQSRNPSIAQRRKKVVRREAGPPKIVSSNEFIEIARQVVAANIRSREEFEQFGLLNQDGSPKARTWMKDCSWPLGNLTLTGKYSGVTKEIWINMVGCALDGMKKTIDNSQGNGEWQPFTFDLQLITGLDSVQRVFLVVQWIDMNNGQDLKYHNGKEASTIEVKNDLSADLLSALKNNSNADQGKLDMLIDLMARREAMELKRMGIGDQVAYNDEDENENENVNEVAATEAEIAPKTSEPPSESSLVDQVTASTVSTKPKRRRTTRTKKP